MKAAEEAAAVAAVAAGVSGLGVGAVAAEVNRGAGLESVARGFWLHWIILTQSISYSA